MAQGYVDSGFWNPDEQFDLDPETGQYTRRPPVFQQQNVGQPPAQSGTNWDDIERQLREAGGGLYDPSDLEGIKRNTSYTDAAGNRTGATLDQALANQRAIYDARRGPVGQSSASPQASPSGGLASAYSSYLGSSNPAIEGLLGELKADRERQNAERADIRKLLMERMTAASRPVSATDPGVREILAAQRLAGQRGAERQRREASELRAYDGSGGLGGKAFEGDVQRILEQQGEAETQAVGTVLGGELSARREELNRLLALAMQAGDSESARSLQAQLALIDQQMTQGRFQADLGFRQSSFLDDLGLRLLMLQMQGNRDAASVYL